MLSSKTRLLREGVNVIGFFSGHFGLAETTRLFVTALKKQSIPYSLISADSLTPGRGEIAHDYTFENKGKYATNLFCTNFNSISSFVKKMGLHHVKNHYNISTCFWETNVVPIDLLKDMECLDEIWVSSHYTKDILSSNISLPVHHIPHPLQLKDISKSSSKADFGLDNKFTFLFCFDFFSVLRRKNPNAVIEAFRKAFPNRNDVQLVIKSQNGQYHKSDLNASLDTIKNDRNIKWIDESMDRNRIDELMNVCDCYVSLHRSEGFGLTMAEAMLLEKPVIATGYSGNLDFMTPENSYLCGYKLVPVGPNNQHYPADGIWADVNIDEAAFWMDYIVNNGSSVKVKAARGREDILRNHSIDTVGCIMAKRLKILSKKSRWFPYKWSKLYIHYLPKKLKEDIHHHFNVLKHYSSMLDRRLRDSIPKPIRKILKRVIFPFRKNHD